VFDVDGAAGSTCRQGDSLDWRAKVELFEQIRREYEFGSWPSRRFARRKAAAPAKGKQGRRAKKAAAAPRRAHVQPTKGKSSRKATPAMKAPKGRVLADVPKAAPPGSKTAKILDLLKRPGGASAKELIKATGWLPHSVRGFLSGTVGKKMGLIVTSSKGATACKGRSGSGDCSGPSANIGFPKAV
jgi:hypothetical protein